MKKSFLKYCIISIVIAFIVFGIYKGYHVKSIDKVSSLEYVSDYDKIVYTKEIIEKEYNIDIIYSDIDNVSIFANKFNANIEYSEQDILSSLNILKEEFVKYEKEVLDDLTVVLFDSFNDNTVALASRNNNNEYRIYLSISDKFKRAMHHELFHILEYRGNGYDTDEWNKLNPIGFEYQDINELTNRYVYGYEYSYNTYFVSKYSKVSGSEDRAEVFAEYMIDSEKTKDDTEYKHIKEKVDYIFSILDEVKY